MTIFNIAMSLPKLGFDKCYLVSPIGWLAEEQMLFSPRKK